MEDLTNGYVVGAGRECVQFGDKYFKIYINLRLILRVKVQVQDFFKQIKENRMNTFQAK